MRRSKSPPNPIPHWCLSKVSRTLSLLDEITLTAPPHGRVERRQTFRIRRPSCQSRAHSTTDSLTERRASGDFRSILLLFLIFPDHRHLSIARPLSRPACPRASPRAAAATMGLADTPNHAAKRDFIRRRRA